MFPFLTRHFDLSEIDQLCIYICTAKSPNVGTERIDRVNTNPVLLASSCLSLLVVSSHTHQPLPWTDTPSLHLPKFSLMWESKTVFPSDFEFNRRKSSHVYMFQVRYGAPKNCKGPRTHETFQGTQISYPWADIQSYSQA